MVKHSIVDHPPRSWHKRARPYLIASGTMLSLASLLLTTLKAQSFAIGLTLLLFGLSRRRIILYHKVIAVILLNTLLLFFAVDLAAGTVLTVIDLPSVRSLIEEFTGQPNDIIAFYQSLSYYAAQDWTSIYWQEHQSALKKTYSPYVIWRSPNYHGTTLNIDHPGIRTTPGSECIPNAIKVFVFGGSSVWGWGAPDWSTIPAILQSKLEGIHNEPVCVVNYGENAYVSTQSLVQLVLLLESGNVPDVVVFYDGVNEVLAASQSGMPLVHQNLLEIATLFQDPQPPLIQLAQNLNSYQLVQMILSQIDLSTTREDSKPEYDPERLADQVAEAYLNNLRIVRSLATTYEFEYYFFWQPYILIGNKQLAPEEQNMITGLNWVLDLNPQLINLFASTYEKIESAASGNKNLYYLGNLFDSVTESIWIDTWGHLTPVGNKLVVGEMFKVIQESLHE